MNAERAWWCGCDASPGAKLTSIATSDLPGRFGIACSNLGVIGPAGAIAGLDAIAHAIRGDIQRGMALFFMPRSMDQRQTPRIAPRIGDPYVPWAMSRRLGIRLVRASDASLTEQISQT